MICNGVVVQGQRQMKHNDWIMLGRASALRIGIPAHESAEIEVDLAQLTAASMRSYLTVAWQKMNQ